MRRTLWLLLFGGKRRDTLFSMRGGWVGAGTHARSSSASYNDQT